MRLFGRKESTTALKATNTDTPSKFGDSWFYPVFGSTSNIWGGSQYLKDFNEVPEVNGIISLKVGAFANGIIKVVSKETGKEVTNNEPIVRAIRNPNYFQSQQEFLQQTKFFHEIYGNELLYFLAPVGMPMNVKAMFTIPIDIVTIREPVEPYFLTTEQKATYWYEWGGKLIQFQPNSIIHINRANVPSGSNYLTQTDLKITNFQQSYMFGSPVLASQQAPVRNIRAAYEARNVLIENRGALGILSNGGTDALGATLPINPSLKDELQEDWRKYGVTKGQFQIIMTSLNLKWQQISIDADKLRLFEEVEADTRQLCLAFGVPYDMISTGTTFDNKLRAERQMYQNTIIPEAQEWIAAINRKAETFNKTWELQISYDHLPIFQENRKEMAAAMQMVANGLEKLITDQVITLEQAKKIIEDYIK